jgi:hypothetical protein
MQGFDLSTAPDLGAIEDEGQTIHLQDEHDEPMYYGEGTEKKPVTWTVKGTYSNTYLAVLKAQKRRLGKRLRIGQDVADATEGNDVEAIVKCTEGFDGFFMGPGKKLPFTAENAMAILTSTRAQHLRAQIERAMGDHERFFRKG